jgi:hypothetical protein
MKLVAAVGVLSIPSPEMVPEISTRANPKRKVKALINATLLKNHEWLMH